MTDMLLVLDWLQDLERFLRFASGCEVPRRWDVLGFRGEQLRLSWTWLEWQSSSPLSFE
jgi:hypothetical protein